MSETSAVVGLGISQIGTNLELDVALNSGDTSDCKKTFKSRKYPSRPPLSLNLISDRKGGRRKCY